MKLMNIRKYALGGKASPPARGRGLKLRSIREDLLSPAVAPRAGAWIETQKTRQW